MTKSFVVCDYETHREMGYFLNMSDSGKIWFLGPDNRISYAYREKGYLKEIEDYG